MLRNKIHVVDDQTTNYRLFSLVGTVKERDAVALQSMGRLQNYWAGSASSQINTIKRKESESRYEWYSRCPKGKHGSQLIASNDSTERVIQYSHSAIAPKLERRGNNASKSGDCSMQNHVGDYRLTLVKRRRSRSIAPNCDLVRLPFL